MPDTTTDPAATTPTPAAPAATSAPPAPSGEGAPAAVPAQPPAPAAAPAAPAAVAPAPTPPATTTTPPKKTKRGGPEIRIPQAAFKARVEREAAAMIRRKLGVTVEEAERLVKAGGGAAGEGTEEDQVKATADAAIEALRKENESLKKRVSKAERETEAWQKKHKKDTQRMRDKMLEADLRARAAGAGVTDPDYAVVLFSRAVVAQKATDPDVYFKELRTTHPHLFGQVAPAAPAPAPRTPVPANTAPPEAPTAPNGQPPAPATPGNQPPPVKVDDLPPQQFSAHTRRKYGFTPGL